MKSKTLFIKTQTQNIPKNWVLVELQQISQITDSLHVTPKYSSKGISMVRSTDIKPGNLNIENTFYVSEDVYEKFTKNHKPGRNDIVMSRVGTYFPNSFVETEQPFCLGQNTLVIHPLITPRFLYYALNSKLIQGQIDELLVGSGGQKTISLKNIRELLILKPKDPNEIESISKILSHLDTKISNLQNQNRILEQTAQAIFQSRFVDFDGVTEFEDSELGKIPKGWSVEKMTEIIEVNPKRKLEKNLFSPFLSMTNIPVHSSRISNFYYRNFTSGTKFENGDTLLARITPSLENGKTAFVDFLQEDEIGWGSTEFIVLRPKAPFPPEYGYCLCRTDELRLHAIANMTGTSGRQRVQESCFDDYKIVKPSLDIIQNFSVISKNIFLKIKENGEAISSLTKTRDALLPKLMSGEIHV